MRNYAVPDAPKTKLFCESATWKQCVSVNRRFAEHVRDEDIGTPFLQLVLGLNIDLVWRSSATAQNIPLPMPSDTLHSPFLRSSGVSVCARCC